MCFKGRRPLIRDETLLAPQFTAHNKNIWSYYSCISVVLVYILKLGPHRYAFYLALLSGKKSRNISLPNYFKPVSILEDALIKGAGGKWSSKTIFFPCLYNCTAVQLSVQLFINCANLHLSLQLQSFKS